MKIEKIKPIPKYIEKLIKKRDLNNCPEQNSVRRFYAYLTKNDGELTKVTVAVKNHKGKWYCKQVAVHGVHSSVCAVKDFAWCGMGGYIVGWHDMGIQSRPKYYEYGEWGYVHDSLLDPDAPVVNMDYIGRFPEFMYSGYEFYDRTDVLQFLRTYEQYPQVEYIVKMGLSHLAMRKQILNKTAKDKHFRKWLYLNRKELKNPYIFLPSIFKAYKTGKPISEVYAYDSAKKHIAARDYDELHAAFADDLEALFAYIGKQQTNLGSYNDYFKACRFLHLDMNLPKNRYPHDFRRWHDIRTDEYESALDALDEGKRKAFYAQFTEVAKKYQSLQYDRSETYVCIIARSPRELTQEGRALHHCVGRMGYDRKVVREQSLIFFVRHKETPEIPFVTVEYSLSERKVLQCYGNADTRPDEKVLDYVNRVWQPYATRKIEKIMMAA